MSLETKRREYAELLSSICITHTNLKDYFSTHARASTLDRNSDDFKTLKNHLKSLDPQRVISREINRYYSIYSRVETLKREIEDYEVPLTGNYFQENFKVPSMCYRRGLVLRYPFISIEDSYLNSFVWAMLMWRGGMEYSQSNLSAYRKHLISFDFSMIMTKYHTFVDYFRIKQFEQANNIAVFLIKPYFPEHNKVYDRPFFKSDLAYKPSIKLSQAKDIVYLAVFKDGIVVRKAFLTTWNVCSLCCNHRPGELHISTIAYAKRLCVVPQVSQENEDQRRIHCTLRCMCRWGRKLS